MPLSFRRNATLGGLYAATVILAALPPALIYVQSRNTLHNNGKWLSTKVTLQRGVPGGVAFRTTRPALHRGRLNLGAWHGFHEVIYYEPIFLTSVAFDFSLAEGAQLSFLFARDSLGYSGIRITRDPRFAPIRFSATPDGLFTRKERLARPALRDGWNHFSMQLARGRATVYLNGEPWDSFPAQHSSDQTIGFRGGRKASLVDHVAVRSARPGQSFRESFDGRGALGYALAAAAALVLLANAALLLLLRTLRTRTSAPRVFYLLAANVVLALGGSLFWAADYYYLSERYTTHAPNPGYRNTIESEDSVLRKIRNYDTSGSEDSHRRILFIGSSQTWGAGASKADDVWVRRIERKLQAQPPGAVRYECINAGISAATSASLLDHFQREWIKLQPDLVVIDLSQNDQDTEKFAASLARFVELSRDIGAKVLFVLEPNSIETTNPTLLRNHEAMHAIADQYGVPIVDMNRLLADNYDRGFLWWDMVHLSSAGQSIFAEELFPAINNVLRN